MQRFGGGRRGGGCGRLSPVRALLRSDVLRTALAMAALSAWMLSLFSGWVFNGAVHLLLAAALVLFPWRWLRTPVDGAPVEGVAVGGSDPESPVGNPARPRSPQDEGDPR